MMQLSASPKRCAIEVVRSARRKTVAIKVQNGQVSVLAPEALPLESIEQVVVQKASWIHKKVSEQEVLPDIPAKQYLSGEAFLYQGEVVTLQVQSGTRAEVALHDHVLTITVPPRVREQAEYVRKILHAWYQQQALAYLEQRVTDLANVVGVEPQSLTVKYFKARWGSCSINRDLKFNWRIVLAPPAVMDYVVIHELCHIHHHNHSPAFWQCVEQFCPDYRDHEAWLKYSGRLLVA